MKIREMDKIDILDAGAQVLSLGICRVASVRRDQGGSELVPAGSNGPTTGDS